MYLFWVLVVIKDSAARKGVKECVIIKLVLCRINHLLTAFGHFSTKTLMDALVIDVAIMGVIFVSCLVLLLIVIMIENYLGLLLSNIPRILKLYKMFIGWLEMLTQSCQNLITMWAV